MASSLKESAKERGGRPTVCIVMAVTCLVLGTSFCSWSYAEEVPELLASCRAAFQRLPAGGLVAICKVGGVWHVTGLRLFGAELSDGDLPILAGFQDLESLEFVYSSRITGDGFKNISSLKCLKRFVAPKNFAGEDLPALSALPRLADLDLSDCRGVRDEDITRLVPFPRLRKLNLTGTGATEGAFQFIRLLGGLEVLNMSGQVVGEAGLTDLSLMANLHQLVLGKMDSTRLALLRNIPQLDSLAIGELVPEEKMVSFSALTNLRTLKVDHITGDTDVQMSLPEQLRELGVSLSRKGKVTIEPPVKNIAKVEANYSGRKVDAEVAYIAWLTSLPELEVLTLEDQPSSEVAAVAALKSLRGLALTGGCGSTGDKGIMALTQLPHLNSLEICNGFGMTDSGMKALEKLPNLVRLKIRYAPHVTAAGLLSIRDIKGLRVLDVSLAPEDPKDGLDGALDHVKCLANLEELTLGGVLTDEGLKKLVGLKKLRILDLSACQGFTDAGLAFLMKALPVIQEVRLSYKL